MQTKMHTKLTSTDVDITKFPEEIDIDPFMTDNTIGDLHANTLLLFYILVIKGFIKISEENYQALVKIYTNEILQPKFNKEPHLCEPAPIFLRDDKKELLNKIFSEYNEIVNEEKITVIDTKTLFRFIGDETVDRGDCDGFTVFLIALLHKQGANFEILASNHGMEFVEACEKFEKNGNKLIAPRMGNAGNHGNSMVALQEFIAAGAINANDIIKIYNESYKKHLKLVSYSLNAAANEIEIFSHAAIGFDHIRSLAEKFDVPYNDSNAVEMAKTIDSINAKFALKVEANEVHTLYTHEMMCRGYGAQYLSHSKEEVVAALIWNRNYSDHNLKRDTNNFKVKFIHGHDSSDTDKVNHLTLNDPLGQFTNYVGKLKVYATNGQLAGPANKPGTSHLEGKVLQAPPQPQPQAPDLSFGQSFPRNHDFNQAGIYNEDVSDSGESSLGLGESTLGLGESSLGLGESSLGLGESSLDLGESSLDLGESSLGLGESSRGLGESSLGDAGLSNPQPNEFFSAFDVSAIHDLAIDSKVSDFSLDVPLFELNNSPLGKGTAVVQENLSLSSLNQSTIEFDLEGERKPVVEIPAINLESSPSQVIDMSLSTLKEHPDYSENHSSDDEDELDFGRRNRLRMDIPVRSLRKPPSENSQNDTLGDAPKFYTKNKITKKEKHPKKEMDPSFIMACCGDFTAAEIIGYTLLVGLLAVAIVALSVASYGVASAAAVATVPLVLGLTFFASNKNKEEINHAKPGDCLGL